jgi:hypothetical protein
MIPLASKGPPAATSTAMVSRVDKRGSVRGAKSFVMSAEHFSASFVV